MNKQFLKYTGVSRFKVSETHKYKRPNIIFKEYNAYILEHFRTICPEKNDNY